MNRVKFLIFASTLSLAGCGHGAEWDNPGSWFHKTEIGNFTATVQNNGAAPIQLSLYMSETTHDNKCDPYATQSHQWIPAGQPLTLNLTTKCDRAGLHRAVDVQNSAGRSIYSDTLPSGSESIALLCNDSVCAVQ